MSTAGEQIDMESAIANVYRGPLDEFVSRRDTLAKELRSAGRREDASAVKSLRKPSRMAWALDMAALEMKGAINALDAAVAATLEAQAADGDVRGASARLRVAVREFAGHAARAAEEVGHRIDQAVIVNGVMAVLGKSDAFSALRRGCLADVPEGGGLDFLSSLPVPELAPRPVQPKPQEATPRPAPSPKKSEAESVAREAARQAGEALAAARQRSEEAQQAFREAESKLQGAEEQLRQAETEVRLMRGERDRARQESHGATARVLEAENAVARAESQLDVLVRSGRAE